MPTAAASFLTRVIPLFWSLGSLKVTFFKFHQLIGSLASVFNIFLSELFARFDGLCYFKVWTTRILVLFQVGRPISYNERRALWIGSRILDQVNKQVHSSFRHEALTRTSTESLDNADTSVSRSQVIDSDLKMHYNSTKRWYFHFHDTRKNNILHHSTD